MGTNYDAMTTRGECDSCGRPGQKLHLGKTSIGWPPLLRLRRLEPGSNIADADRDPIIETFADWLVFVCSDEVTGISDEYGNTYTAEELLERLNRIAEKWPENPPMMPGDYLASLGSPPNREVVLENGWRGLFEEFS